MKKLLLLILTSLPAVAMENTKQLAAVLAFSKDVVRSKESLGDIELFKHEDDFFVAKNGIATPVKKYDVDSLLKKANPTQLEEYLKQGGYIQVDQLSNDDYVLRAKGRLNGGGLLGATVGCYIGKYGTYLVGHGTIVVASAMTGTGFLATFLALEGQFAPAIEAASNTAAVAVGMACAVATGPA